MAAAADLDAHADDLVEKLRRRAVASSEPGREWTRDELYDDHEHRPRWAVTLVVIDTKVIVYRYDARDDAKRRTAASHVLPLTPAVVLEAVRGVRDHRMPYYEA